MLDHVGLVYMDVIGCIWCMMVHLWWGAENRHLQLMNKYVEDCGNIQNV